MTAYVVCLECQPARRINDFERAEGCKGCGGRGFLPRSAVNCNMCGGSLCPDTTTPNQYYPNGLINAEVMGCYDSEHLTDCTTYRFSLCEWCLRQMFGQFKVPPEVDGIYDIYRAPSYAADLEIYNHNQWVKTGKQRAKLLTGICNYDEACTSPATWRKFLSGSLTDQAWCDGHHDHEGGGILNAAFLPANKLRDFKDNFWSLSYPDKCYVASIYLDHICYPEAPNFLGSVPECVPIDYSGAPEGTYYSGVALRKESPVAESVEGTKTIHVPGWRVIYGPSETVGQVLAHFSNWVYAKRSRD